MATSTELNATANRLKEMQNQWRTLARLDKAGEEELFKRFRAACDRFFSERQAYFERREAQFASSAELKTQPCATSE